MRLDRDISIAVAAALGGRDRPFRVAALMYHSVSDREEERASPYYKTNISPERFRRHMDWLAGEGARVLPLRMWNSPPQDRALRVVITFDDGYADFAENAFPALRDHNFPATVFLPTGFIETGKELMPGAKHLTWREIATLSEAGVDFGSHTVSHIRLDRLPRGRIFSEIEESGDEIGKRTGKPVASFSCPFAFPWAYPATIAAMKEALARSGYDVAVTTEIGRSAISDDPYTLKRLPLNDDDDKKLFLAKLRGGYDWLLGAQRAIKLLKRAREACGPSR